MESNPTMRHRHKRRLLEDEDAAFEQQGEKISFHDPILSVSSPGLVITRVNGLEKIITFTPGHLQEVLPEEFLMAPGKLTLTFVSTDGKTIRGEMQLTGKSVCRRIGCILCIDFFRQLNCLPPVVAYLMYVLCIILAALSIIYLKAAVYAVVGLMKAIGLTVYHLYRVVRGTARLTMIGGAGVGRRIRAVAVGAHRYLDEVGRPNNIATSLVVLAIITIVGEIHGSCNNHVMVSSIVKNCEQFQDQETCQMTTQAQITLENIDFQQCVWFQDPNRNTVFSVKMRLRKVKCSWNTHRTYYTFPTETKVVSQVACSQNYLCGWGEHCKDGRSFPAETRESKDYPGINRCIAVDAGSSSCLIIDSQPCLFYRAFLVPDFLRTYEVRAITGYSCAYEVEIEELANGTTETMVVKHLAATKSGIRVQVVGAYDQPTQLMNVALISRVGQPTESYLDQVSPAGAPANNMVGHVQANATLTKNFIFNTDLIECNAYEETLHCRSPHPYISRLIDHKQNALPKTMGYHFFYLDAQERLTSDLLFTAPVNVILSFEDYKITLERRTVCPKFTTDPIKTSGCYACAPLARISFVAMSTCAEGMVSVSFERITVATRTVRLTTLPKEHHIEFKGEIRCISDKLCLHGRSIHSCHPLTFCLEAPHIELLQPNITTLHLMSAGGGTEPGFFSGWSQVFPTGLFTSWWKAGLLVCTVGFACIFMCSVCVTCLKGR